MAAGDAQAQGTALGYELMPFAVYGLLLLPAACILVLMVAMLWTSTLRSRLLSGVLDCVTLGALLWLCSMGHVGFTVLVLLFLLPWTCFLLLFVQFLLGLSRWRDERRAAGAETVGMTSR